MPDYSFGATGQLQELLDAIKQAQQNQEPQEPPKPADIITEATMQRVNANNEAYAQQQAQAAAQQTAQQAAQAQAAQQQQQQLMNPAQWHYGKAILPYKNAYENADVLARALNPTVTDEAQLGAAADALRGLAHKNADNIRQIAKDAGIDLSGIEDASYADAQRNMMTRQTKEVANLLSGQGKYGRNADRYFDDEYMALIGEGKSANDAKRIAGQRAQRYQADRVTYLRNAYNMYGRDGNYTNEYGVPILQEIAMEMPEVAQVYATAYKLPTAAQERAEELYDTERGYQNTADMKHMEFMQNLFKDDMDFRQLLQQLALQQGYTQDNIRLGSELGTKKMLEQIEAQFKADVKKYEIKGKIDIDQALEKYRRGYIFGMEELGLTPFEARKYAGTLIGVKYSDDGKPVNDKDTIDGLTKANSAFETSIKRIEDILNNPTAALSDQERAELQQQLTNLRKKQRKIQNDLFGLTGGGSESSQDKGGGQKLNITGNWTNDASIFAALRNSMQRKGYSTAQIRKGLYDIAIEYGYTPGNAQQALGISKDEVARWQR